METTERQTKPLSLDEAIAHADEAAGDCGTACKREHKQLADWLRELRSRRSADPGDTAKLREALEAIDKNTDLLDIAENIAPKLHPSHSYVAVQIRKIARAALATPPRNCDVGTPGEQADRAFAFCLGRSCETCEFTKLTFRECTLAWAQLPCGKRGAK